MLPATAWPLLCLTLHPVTPTACLPTPRPCVLVAVSMATRSVPTGSASWAVLSPYRPSSPLLLASMALAPQPCPSCNPICSPRLGIRESPSLLSLTRALWVTFPLTQELLRSE